MQICASYFPLIGEFAYRYIRFERYLTDNGYKFAQGKNIYPDVKKYSSILHEVKYYIEDFPELQKELKRRNLGGWEVVIAESNSFSSLLIKVAKVRNNLFHGSKTLHDNDRDIKLIKESIHLLDILSSHDKEYKKYL